jgi:hypothetical protein
MLHTGKYAIVQSNLNKSENGKPVEKQGRKVMGLKVLFYTNDCQAAEGYQLFVYLGLVINQAFCFGSTIY